MTVTTSDVYYDPYDREILADPYPCFRRLRDAAPLYYNERYDFWAVSRFADVEAALIDKNTFSNEKGVLLDIVKADIEMPPGTLIHEQDPSHAIHRQLLSRVFTPRAMLAIEPQVRSFCAQRLDELVGRDSFDVVTEFAEFVPMRVFGMLLGIPEEDQQRVFEHVEQGMNTEPGGPSSYEDGFPTGDFYAEWVDARIANPKDDIITRLVSTEFEDEQGVHRTLTREETLMYLSVIAGAGNHTTNRLISWTAKVLADHADARRELVADRSLIPARSRRPSGTSLRAPRSRAGSPRTSRSMGRWYRGGVRCCASWDPPTATSANSRTRTASTSTGRSATTSRSATGRISAWARHWLASRAAWRSKRC